MSDLPRLLLPRILRLLLPPQRCTHLLAKLH
jgi:hypothetical protein